MAENVVMLDIRKLSSIADYIIICSAGSERQVKAIADNIEEGLRKKKLRPLGVEGLAEGRWGLMDYNDVIVHIFFEPVRAFYDLEGLWADAPRVDVADSGAGFPDGGKRKPAGSGVENAAKPAKKS